MKKISELLNKSSKDFLDKYVLSPLGFDSVDMVDENNVNDVISFIIDNYEVPLREEISLNESCSALLYEANQTVDNLIEVR